MGDERQRQPWERREGETATAHAAFLEYLAQGYGRRSLRALASGNEKTTKSRLRSLARWSSTHEWVARADAYDAHELAEEMASREQRRERLRARALSDADEMYDELLDIARGNGSYTATGAPASKDQLEAIDRILALAGAAPPERVEHTGRDGAPLIPAADPRTALRDLVSDPDAAAALRAIAERRASGG